jgi:hypothetical protein
MEFLTLDGGNKLEIKNIDNRYAIVKGYGVVFNGRDYVGDTFIRETEFNYKRIVGTPIFLEHGLEGYKKQVGEVIAYGVDELGMWIEAKVDSSLRIVSEYLEKIRKGLVGWSSGATGHLVDRIKNVITRWTIAEFSLTTHPADRRTLGVQQIKNISPEIASILEAAQDNRKEENAREDYRNIGLNTTVKINTRVSIKVNGKGFN